MIYPEVSNITQNLELVDHTEPNDQEYLMGLEEPEQSRVQRNQTSAEIIEIKHSLTSIHEDILKIHTILNQSQN